MVMSRIEIAEAFAREHIERNPNITGVIVCGSTARNDGVESSDIDIHILSSDDTDIKRQGAAIWRDGVFIDAGYVSADRYSDPTDILKDPYLAGAIRYAVILFDRDGAFADVQKEVVDHFMEPKWLKLRLSSLVPSIERNHKQFAVAVKEDNEAEACRTSIFALWTICDALLVRHGISPSWVRGLQKLGKILPLERDQIIDIEGSSDMTPDQVSSLISLFQQSTGPALATQMMQHVQNAVEWMIQSDLHREALHTLWIAVGLTLRMLMSSDEDDKQRQAQSLAHSWLAKINWRDEMLKSKKTQLGDYVSHVLQLIRAVG
jgi:hypothetical protein